MEYTLVTKNTYISIDLSLSLYLRQESYILHERCIAVMFFASWLFLLESDWLFSKLNDTLKRKILHILKCLKHDNSSKVNAQYKKSQCTAVG